jgi:hypothetical protein
MKMKVTKSRMMVMTALISGLVSLGMGTAQAADSTLIVSGGNGVFNLGPITINGTASSVGTVKFLLGGKEISGCEAVATSAANPFVAKCAWTPAAAGPAVLTGEFTPTDSTLTKATSNTVKVTIGVPVQGVVSPIHIYVDTVLASGSTGVIAPRFNGCAIMNEFLMGQTIVFRIYANNADQGGAVMDTTNTAKAFIEVAGIKDPIPLTYGNHSGVAFWTAILKTGVAPAYNTLGVINYKVTLVAKDSDTMKVLSTKLVAKKNANGTRVVDASGKAVYDRVTYYRTVQVSPSLKGATGTWSSNFTAASQLSLFAAPAAK